jgi:hypothetical protein
MYKLVSFPHYTCGGLLCDILNGTVSKISSYNGGIHSYQHNLGKIGDNDTVFDDFDQDVFFEKLKDCNDSHWIGTHCWLGNTSLDSMDKVLNITTATYKSRLYRWIRSVKHYYIPSEPWQSQKTVQNYRDKAVSTAKNYLIPFRPIESDKVINIEFSDVVELKPEFVNFISEHDWKESIDRWQKQNSFLYEPDLLKSFEAEVYHEAEHEVNLNNYYVYES